MNVTSKADTRADLHLNLLLPFAEALRQTGPVRPLWTTDKQFQISTIVAVRERSDRNITALMLTLNIFAVAGAAAALLLFSHGCFFFVICDIVNERDLKDH